MVLRLSHAPKLGAALAIGLIATGIAVSQNQSWDRPVSPVVPPAVSGDVQADDDMFGPPMPAHLAETDEAPTIASDGEAPEIALELPNRSFDPNDSMETPVVTAQDQVPEIVRMIEMPRREDELDNLGRPVDTPDEYEVAALPSPNAPADDTNGSTAPQPVPEFAEPLVAPVPAPAYRRPIESYINSNVAPVHPQQTVVGFDPVITGQVEPYIQDGNWPRRLDQVPQGQVGQPRVVQVGPGNLFMSDWVEVETRRGGARRVFVGQ